MLIFDCLRALIRVIDKRGGFEVSYSIEVPRMPQSGLGQSLALTGYSRGLT